MEDQRGTSTAQFAGVGLQFALSIIVFLFAGQWLDRKAGTSPLFLMIGVFVGGGAAFYSMYRRLTAANAAEEARRTGAKPGPTEKGESR